MHRILLGTVEGIRKYGLISYVKKEKKTKKIRYTAKYQLDNNLFQFRVDLGDTSI